MLLCPRERDALITHAVGCLAQKRLARGVLLNHVEAVGLIACQLHELIRDGHSVAELMQVGKEILGFADVLPGVPDMIQEVQVEGTFPDGTKLVTVHHPICRRGYGRSDLSLYGSFIELSPEEKEKRMAHSNKSTVEPVDMDDIKLGTIPCPADKGPTFLSPFAANRIHAACESDCARAVPGASSVISFPGETIPDRPGAPEDLSWLHHSSHRLYRDSDDEDGSDDGIPSKKKETEPDDKGQMIELNSGRRRILLTVASRCDRPIQIGSHFHFSESNARLEFDRVKAIGMRLNIPAGHSVRFEPGETLDVPLVEIAGFRRVFGGNRLTDGPVEGADLEEIISRINTGGFLHKEQSLVPVAPPTRISRELYAKTFGPTVGDRIRLGDTNLLIEVEHDYAVYGDECRFGGGKVIREGMGQMSQCSGANCADTIITNVVVLDPILGVLKADVGIKGSLICGIGKAGNPDMMAGVHKNLIVGVGTEMLAGEGLIMTAGGIDTHVHFICPDIAFEALSSGITTLIGGGTGPAEGSKATTCTPGANHLRHMAEATDDLPVNMGFTGKGNSSCQRGSFAADLEEQVINGAIGLKVHEDWGSTPAAIDSCLAVAERYDIQVTIHTDTLNESCCVEETIAAFGGRTIHTYHTEGAGGGHAPDLLRVVGEPRVIPSSTNPTRPFTINTVDEHVDMLVACHHLDKNLKEDLNFAESRIRAETIQAEDILHDLGAVSIVSSDAQAMGRVAEVVARTWQTAAKMREQRGPLDEDLLDGNDNFRARRYLAKYTINPAVAHGISHLVGSIEVGKVADLVLWNPVFFGIKPKHVMKSGQITWSDMGVANGSIPSAQPIMGRPMFGALGRSPSKNSYLFVSQACLDQEIPRKCNWKVQKQKAAVKNCRNITKSDMVLNDLCPEIRVNPETYQVQLFCEVACETPSVLNTPPLSDGQETHLPPFQKAPLAPLPSVPFPPQTKQPEMGLTSIASHSSLGTSFGEGLLTTGPAGPSRSTDMYAFPSFHTLQPPDPLPPQRLNDDGETTHVVNTAHSEVVLLATPAHQVLTSSFAPGAPASPEPLSAPSRGDRAIGGIKFQSQTLVADHRGGVSDHSQIPDLLIDHHGGSPSLRAATSYASLSSVVDISSPWEPGKEETYSVVPSVEVSGPATSTSGVPEITGDGEPGEPGEPILSTIPSSFANLKDARLIRPLNRLERGMKCASVANFLRHEHYSLHSSRAAGRRKSMVQSTLPAVGDMVNWTTHDYPSPPLIESTQKASTTQGDNSQRACSTGGVRSSDGESFGGNVISVTSNPELVSVPADAAHATLLTSDGVLATVPIPESLRDTPSFFNKTAVSEEAPIDNPTGISLKLALTTFASPSQDSVFDDTTQTDIDPLTLLPPLTLAPTGPGPSWMPGATGYGPFDAEGKRKPAEQSRITVIDKRRNSFEKKAEVLRRSDHDNVVVASKQLDRQNSGNRIATASFDGETSTGPAAAHPLYSGVSSPSSLRKNSATPIGLKSRLGEKKKPVAVPIEEPEVESTHSPIHVAWDQDYWTETRSPASSNTQTNTVTRWVTLECEPAEVLPLAQRYLLF